MARQTIAISSPPAARTCAAPVETEADFTEFDRYLTTGQEFLVATNSHTATITVIIRHPDEPNCTAFECEIPTGESRMFPRLPAEWRQADGYIYVDNDGTDVADAEEGDLTYQLFNCDPSGGCAPCP